MKIVNIIYFDDINNLRYFWERDWLKEIFYNHDKIKYNFNKYEYEKKYEKNFYGCGCYLITKKGAKKIIDSIPKIDNKYDLRNIKQIIIDLYIYENLNSYTIPLFTTNTDFKSNIHQDHIKRIHIPSKEIITNLWKTK